MQRVVIGEEPLSLDAVGRIAAGAPVALAASAWPRIEAGRHVVEALIARGEPAYGVTTGVGSQKDFVVSAEAMRAFNASLLIGHGTEPTHSRFQPPSPQGTRRAALAIQLAGFATGRSGVTRALVERMLARLADDHALPEVGLGTSVGASDIIAMARLAVPLSDTGLAGKEALSLLNANALTLAHASLALLSVRHQLTLADQIAALSLEGFRGNPGAWSAAIDAAGERRAQAVVGARLRAALAGSRLHEPGEARLLQDPLSFRCVPQIHGAASAALDWASRICEAELATAADNPLADVASGRLVSHGNMETTLLAVALDALRLAHAKLLTASAERVHKLQWTAFSGLPTGLAETPSAAGGVQFLNLGHHAAAALMRARQAATPASLAFIGHLNDGVEDVAGAAPLAVEETERLADAARAVLAVEAACAAWAVARRGIGVEALGEGVRTLQAAVRAVLPIGHEGETVFSLETVAAACGL